MADEVKTEEQVMAEAQELLDAETDERALIDRKQIVIDAIVRLTWETMRAHDLESCITGARVAFDVCRAHDIRVRALSTKVRIYNAPMVARMVRGEVPSDVQEIDRWNREDGSWNVGIGGFGYDKPDHFDGHLVVIADERVLVDPTLPQANRPQYDIELSGLAGRIPDGWPRRENDVPIQLEQNGCVVTYEAQADDRRWVATDSWKSRELREPVVGLVSSAVDSALADL